MGRVVRRLLCAAALVAAAEVAPGEEPAVARPFEAEAWTVPATPLDDIVLAALREKGIEPARPCSDAVFLRRAYLDVIGTLPEPAETRRFLADTRKDKRAALIDSLLAREEFADWWALRWCDALRVKAEFPINLWPNAAQAYHRWIRDRLHENEPYDRFARDLLTSSGSNFRDPAVNFWRAVQGREPAALAGAVALTFLGSRIETWPEDRRAGFAALFSRVAYKKTAEWKEEIVLLDPAPAGPLDAVLPDGTKVRVAPDDDPRRVFADWLVRPENPWFARAIANRVWAWLMGRGIVREPDDFRPTNPPSIPALLDHLAAELVRAGWDLKRLFRLILESRTYQQSCIPRSEDPSAAALFAWYPVRRLEAEALIDALCWIGGAGERYSSNVPEPWSFLPEDHRTIELPDGSITSKFLETFGRPARDTGLASERSDAPTGAQRLHLLNASDVERRIERSRRLRTLFASARGDRAALVRLTYLALLSRPPEPAEAAAAEKYLSTPGTTLIQAADDLAWALVNTKEFLFRH